MPNTPSSYFIPKQASTAVPTRTRKKRSFNFLSFIGIAVFVGALALAGFTFYYKSYTEKQLADTKQQLAAESARFNDSDIATVRAFERRLKAAEYLLDSHAAPSRVFDALELSTRADVQFLQFVFEQGSEGSALVTLGGGTEEFKQLAQQAVELSDNELLDTSQFTDITTELVDLNQPDTKRSAVDADAPTVTFALEARVSREELMFDGQFVQRIPDSVFDEFGVGGGDATEFTEGVADDSPATTQ